ncbi:hypothetical protein [Sphingomonas fuzhouensis]|uniref:hypothetical protein n=1 Tax=Sphingomonas fuzhouensis TaxID=3106033 RepID=UPI002AFECBF2|nr:hypothetical protein [Sphingomonas sp. SGZ-02]
MPEYPEPRRVGIHDIVQSVGPDVDRRQTNDVGLAHAIALLELLNPRQAALALVVLTTGTDAAAAIGMRWREIDEATGLATLYDPALMFERVVPLPKITYDAVRRLSFDGKDTVFAEDLDDAWPYRLVTEFDDGVSAEVVPETFEEGFLRTAGRLRMLQTVVDQIAPPPFAVRSGQIERYSDVVEAVTAHFVPLIRDARRAVAKQHRAGAGHDVSS